MVLSPSSALPRATTPSSPARSAFAKVSGSSVAAPPVAGAIRRNSVPYSGPLAPPTDLTSVMPACLNSAAGSSAGGVAEGVDHRAHPAMHVGAVVGVADGGVEGGQLVLVLGHGRGERPQPALQGVERRGIDRHHMPQRRPEVATGASQSRSSSSSSCVMLTEHPAMSRLVT